MLQKSFWFLYIAEKLGYNRDHILSFVDKERNMPLHSAVNSGDRTTVRLLLENGANIDAQQVSQFNISISAAQYLAKSCFLKLLLKAELQKD